MNWNTSERKKENWTDSWILTFLRILKSIWRMMLSSVEGEQKKDMDPIEYNKKLARRKKYSMIVILIERNSPIWSLTGS